MRITEVRRYEEENGDRTIAILFIQDDGVSGQLAFPQPDPLPEDWRAWAREWITERLQGYTLGRPYDLLWPHPETADTAQADLENLPGWATWSAAEGQNYIDSNVTDLASAKVVLRSMAAAILHLRDLVIPR